MSIVLSRGSCINCGSQLFWQSDFDAEDVGYDRKGIVSYWTCGHCGAEIECYIPEKEEENVKD